MGAGAQKEIHPPERMASGRRPHRAGGSKRHRNRRGGHMEPVAIPTDQREKRTPRRGSGPTKLGGMEEPPRPPTHIQYDTSAHRTRRVRRVPEENKARDDRHLPPLRRGQGHSAAHPGALSGVGAAPLHPAARHRRNVDTLSDCRSDVERVTGIRGRPPLLRASYAREGASGKREKKKLSPLQDKTMEKDGSQTTQSRPATTPTDYDQKNSARGNNLPLTPTQ
ncbi:uncharacterized protein LOC143304874 [Bombus vancouverensis nearcticus]|uniref:uncharacterized protein LOC143304874 n=1 Tax=Bombus vancouverensis nearcticus TaxID=2705178 RepID=UPI00402B53AC